MDRRNPGFMLYRRNPGFMLSVTVPGVRLFRLYFYILITSQVFSILLLPEGGLILIYLMNVGRLILTGSGNMFSGKLWQLFGVYKIEWFMIQIM